MVVELDHAPALSAAQMSMDAPKMPSSPVAWVKYDRYVDPVVQFVSTGGAAAVAQLRTVSLSQSILCPCCFGEKEPSQI